MTNEWQLITDETPEVDRCLLWCSDLGSLGKVEGVCIGYTYHSYNGVIRARSSGKMGDWTYTHWMPIPAAPAQS